jgi:ribosome-associated toxin RatA of RatAB toxin-antitoxin module
LTVIHKSTLVPYSADEMYALVNDIESYPDFLRWCKRTQILYATDTNLQATIAVEAGKIKQSFTTENSMQPGREINMQLVEGPFKYLRGKWQFEPQADQTCRITLDIQFEFKNKLFKLALNKMFNYIMNSMIGSFSQRACEIYGER